LLLPRWLDPAAFCQPKTHSLYRRVWRYDSIKNSGSGATTVLHSLRRYGNTAELQGDTSILYDPLTRAKDLPYLLQQKVISAKRIICHALGLTTEKKIHQTNKKVPSTLVALHVLAYSYSPDYNVVQPYPPLTRKKNCAYISIDHRATPTTEKEWHRHHKGKVLPFGCACFPFTHPNRRLKN
jgi:hypothetical protein